MKVEREEQGARRKENRIFVDEGGVWCRGVALTDGGRIEQWRYMCWRGIKKKLQC